MDGPEYARRAHLNISIEGVDVSRDVAPFLLSFEYSDNKSGEADEVQIDLMDPDGRFRGDWLPARNSKLVAEIVIDDWRYAGDVRSLKCGSFEIDELEASGPPGILKIKGVSVPVTSAARREHRSRAWEKVTLREIASDAAKEASLMLSYEATINPRWERMDQKEESALAFLNRMAERSGLSVKAVGDKLVVFDDDADNGKVRIELGGGEVESWNFKTQSGDSYKACKVKYRDSKKKDWVVALAQGKAADDGKAPSGQTKQINTRAENSADAQRIADSSLRKANRKEVTGSLTLLGNPSLVVGMKVELSGFGTFDGEYCIAKTTHSFGGGYTTSIEVDDGSADVRSGGKGSRKKKGKNEADWMPNLKKGMNTPQ